jgi:hypothetical protein
VSLILEALKKLERDRQTHERGFLVLGQPAWSATGERGWTGRAPLLAAAALAGGAIAAVVLWPGRSGEQPDQAPATTLAAGPAAPLASAPPPTGSAAPLAAASPAAPRPLVVWRPVYRSARPRPAVQDTVPPAVEPTVPPAAQARIPPVATPTPAPAAEALQLQAISERDGAPVAVVSGQMVRIGDRIGNGTVVRIGAAEVEIETDGQRRVLKF